MARCRHYVVETLLWCAAGLGAIAIVLVLCAHFFNISIILFRTGSMEPTISAGSASLVREIPASEVEVGDVLTVSRPDHMPVTHRVTSVAAGEHAEERVITMQGDANESPDPDPYRITEGRVVMGSVPGVAPFIHQMGNPYVLGGLTVAAAVLVSWAFWPRKPAGQAVQSHRQPRRRSGSSVTVLAPLVGVSIPLTVLSAPEAMAQAADPEEVVRESVESQYISLESAYIPEQRLNMFPADSARWDITITIDGPEPGDARAGISMQGDFALDVTITSCDQQWTAGPERPGPPSDFCPGTATTLLEDERIDPSGDILWLQEFSSDQTVWLRVDTDLPQGTPQSPAGTSALQLRAEAAGDTAEASTGPASEDAQPSRTDSDGGAPSTDHHRDGSLAQTGFTWGALILVSIILLIIGRALQLRARRSAPDPGSEDL